MSKNNSSNEPVERTDRLEGIAASSGIARGNALVFGEVDLSYEERSIDDTSGEVERLDTAISTAIGELETLKEHVRTELGEESAHIFRSQQTIIEDDSLRDEMKDMIVAEHCCAESAVDRVFSVYLKMFEELGEDDYNRERVADLSDVKKRVLRVLLGKQEISLAGIDEPSIVVAAELFPSDTAQMNTQFVLGMVTERGGITSHAAILANNLGIPASVGTVGAIDAVAGKSEIYLDVTDADTAYVYIDPDAATASELDTRRDEYTTRQKQLAKEKGLDPITTDGHRVTISANIGSTEEISGAVEAGGKSVGLFRSEFLFINQPKIPDEEKQFSAYKEAVEAFHDGFVVLRTLDIGADKSVESISLPTEENPFLGYRGVRISLGRSDLFSQQLRAALRASAFGPMKIMFPMVSGPNEVRAILAEVDRHKRALTEEGIAFDESTEIGIMVEVPSTVLMAPELAKMVDFFSIGTNDLTQYLLAADRMNEEVRDYYQPFHPAVFRAIKNVVDAAHKEEKWVGICGELGGMPAAIPALVGIGVDELSMSGRSIPEAIHVIRRTSLGDAQKIAEEILAMDDQNAVKQALQHFIENQE